MNLHRVGRIAGVLVASQLRAGRSTSNPKSFLGRGYSILIYDALGFGLIFLLARAAADELAVQAPAVLARATAVVEPSAPLLGLAVVLVAGVMFELTTTGRFAASDAVNWLPVRTDEYVAGSAVAIAYTYSIAVAVLLGVTLALGIATDTLAAFAAGAFLAVLGLFEGGVLIEILRAVTQRTGQFLGRRAGRLTVIARIAALLVVILLFQLFFNPVLLEGVLGSFGSLEAIAPYVPFFWGTAAVDATVAGAPLLALAFGAGALLVVGVLLALAVQVRSRFWSPAEEEVQLEAHRFGTRHRGLAALGLAPVQAAIAAKDLQGLVRRREMVPMLVMPIVLAVVGLITVSGPGPAGSDRFTGVLWVAWIAGFYALLLAATSIGQERRAFQVLYCLPVRASDVFRAKFAVVLLPAVLFGVVWSVVTAFLGTPDPKLVVASALLAALTSVEGALVGLAFAARYSDFQDRPRPQFLRPAPMLATTLGGLALIFATVIPIDLAVTGTGGGPAPVFLAVGLGLGLGVAGLAYAAARTGFRRLMEQLPF